MIYFLQIAGAAEWQSFGSDLDDTELPDMLPTTPADTTSSKDTTTGINWSNNTSPLTSQVSMTTQDPDDPPPSYQDPAGDGVSNHIISGLIIYNLYCNTMYF